MHVYICSVYGPCDIMDTDVGSSFFTDSVLFIKKVGEEECRVEEGSVGMVGIFLRYGVLRFFTLLNTSTILARWPFHGVFL